MTSQNNDGQRPDGFRPRVDFNDLERSRKLGLSLAAAGRLDEAGTVLAEALSLAEEVPEQLWLDILAGSLGPEKSQAPSLRPDFRLGFVSAANQNDGFIKPLVRRFSKICQVRKLVPSGPADVDEMLSWADLTWFEWCDSLAIYASKAGRRGRMICRLHRYEAFSNMPGQVQWENVDLLIAACNDFVLEALKRKVPNIEQRTRVRQILNGIDLEEFRFVERSKGHDIACLGYLNPRKNPMFLLQCFRELLKKDRRFRLHFGGSFQDQPLERYVREMALRLGLSEAVFFHGWQKDVPGWLEDKHFVVSTSIGEGHPFGLLEAMAMGLKPAVHNFPGAEGFYPRAFVFNTADEFCRIFLGEDYHSGDYREFVKKNHDMDDYIRNMTGLFLEVIDGRLQA